MNAILTQQFKNLIQQKGLVDTGALLNSVVVNAKLTGSELFLDIVGVNYLPYVIAEYDLLNEWQKDPLVSDEISNLVDPVIQQMVQDAINGAVNETFPSIYVTVNGI
jgi:hypothetical protein